MTDGPDIAERARYLDSLYREKAVAEIAAAERLTEGKGAVRGQGDPLAEVLLVKGEPGPGDRSAGRALAGDDGAAIGKALDALGLSKSRFAFCTRTGPAESDRIGRVRLLVEAVDPRQIVLLDGDASVDFAAAYGVNVPGAGTRVRVRGRAVVAVDAFEASLNDEAAKRRSWKQLQALAAERDT